MNVTQILPNGGRAPGERAVLYGEVSRVKPAPSAKTDPLFVVIPDRDPNEAIQFDHWPMCHGNSLPALGAMVLVVSDSRNGRWVVSWDGPNS